VLAAARSYNPNMVSWRCPHCGTPQLEAARCWVCHRSTTSCSTCRHFRSGLTAKLGYCVLDRERRVLTGAEERPCWERSSKEAEAIARLNAGLVAPWTDPEPDPEAGLEDGYTLDALALNSASRPGANAADDLWSLYLAGPSPQIERRREPADTTVRSAGMWVDRSRSEPALPPPPPPLTARHRNVRSVRHRPWGPVPGQSDAYVQSLRVPERVRRPSS
jgi:hypothetical protein